MSIVAESFALALAQRAMIEVSDNIPDDLAYGAAVDALAAILAQLELLPDADPAQ